MLNRIQEISRKSICQYSEARQQRKLSEECGELISEINRFQEGRSSWDKLAMEVADVEICCYHMREMIGHELVDAAKRMKLKRLAINLGMEIDENSLRRLR